MRARGLLLPVLLVLLVGAVYAPVWNHEFLSLDDIPLIVQNPGLRGGLDGASLSWALTHTDDGNWIPLTWISYLVDRELHDLSPRGTHLGNVLLHAASAVLLLLALLRLGIAPWVAAFVAAVFAVHPLHVESVAWAIERKDVLSGLLFHATLLAYAGYAKEPGTGRYLCVVSLLTLGLMAKPMLVTLPFVLLLLDFWPLGRLDSRARLRSAVLEKLPLLVPVLGVVAITLQAQGAVQALNLGGEIGPATRLGNAVVSYAMYLRNAVWPLDLAVFYPLARDGLPLATVLGCLAPLATLGATALWQARARPWLLTGLCWYAGMLLPVIGLVQVGMQSMADRYTYLPLTGVALALAMGGNELARRSATLRRAVGASAIVAVVVLAGLSFRQLTHWRDSLTLSERALAVSEPTTELLNGHGAALLAAGYVDQAVAQLERAVALEPRALDAQANLGIALVAAGQPEAALPHLRLALALPESRQGSVHASIGMARRLQGRPEDALRELERAEALGHTNPELVAVRAQLERSLGRNAAAVASYRRVLSLRPDWPAVLNNLAWILATDADPALRSPAEAVRLAERAVELTGGSDPAPLDTLATAYDAAGRAADAERSRRRAATLAAP